MQENTIYSAGLYLRLSKDDEQTGESVSIGTQRSILTEYCKEKGYKIGKIYVDDGYSGLNFNRPGFQELLEDIKAGHINMVITKDLSRLGRDYIMTGYYSEIFFPSEGVRYLALADNFDSLKGGNEIAPFKNILNDMYARDLSKKIKTAKQHMAKQGLFIGSQAPYGYRRDPNDKHRLIVDPEAAGVVRLIFSLAEQGLGNVAIAAELRERKIVAPSVYKYQNGDQKFSRYSAVKSGDFYKWSYGMVGLIISNPVYTGTLVTLKTQSVSYKTKHRIATPREQQIITEDSHEAIVSTEVFERIKQVRASHRNPGNAKRFNLFRNKLFCECCGHPLTISKKQLLDGETDMYLCMYHFHHPEVCPKTHRVYHEMLYSYVLEQIRIFARSTKRRKVNSNIAAYTSIEDLTPEILDDVIERIEIGHVRKNSRPGSVIHIYWKLR